MKKEKICSLLAIQSSKEGGINSSKGGKSRKVKEETLPLVTTWMELVVILQVK